MFTLLRRIRRAGEVAEAGGEDAGSAKRKSRARLEGDDKASAAGAAPSSAGESPFLTPLS